jgi:hypothetical protein
MRNRAHRFAALHMSAPVKVFGCRPLTEGWRAHGRPASENLQGRCYGAGGGEDIASVDADVNRWRATPCRS